MASEFKWSLRSLHGSLSDALQMWRYHHSRPDGHRIENDLRKTAAMIKRDRLHLGKRTRKTHPVGRKICEVEEESKQGGGF